MMQVFTVLLIYYHVYSTDMVSEIWFENYAQCEKVLRSEALEIIYKTSRDVHISCERSNVISSTPRPQLRPKDLNNG